jgi:hypothetical protein
MSKDNPGPFVIRGSILEPRFELTNTGRRMDVRYNLDYEVLRLSLPEGVVPADDDMQLTLESTR